MILRLKSPTHCRVDMSPINPSLCIKMNELEVAMIRLLTTAGKCCVGDLFSISKNDKEQLIIEGDCSSMDWIAKDMDGGSLHIEGDAGNMLACNMSGGVITVNGSAGHHTASAMTNGSLHIHHNSGDFLAGALPGNSQGMRGGTIIIHGTVGNRLGDCMRRGLIIVKKSVGEYCASRMIAGTIVCNDNVGKHIGFSMRRGSILLSQKIEIDETFFTPPHYQEISFLPLLIKHLHQLDKDFAHWKYTRHAQRSIGDLSVSGQGEILLV